MTNTVTHAEALDRLIAGNERYVSGNHQLDTRVAHANLTQLSQGQAPFAVILGCSDSRVPVEIVFDQGLGDLFVIRVAGNIVSPSQVGSIEFAASTFATQLVVVLGHSGCGAVTAALAADDDGGALPGSVDSIVNRIRPALTALPSGLGDEERLHQAVRINVQHSVDQLCNGSPILEQLLSTDKLAIVGAEYDMASGRVEFGIGG
ncbi:MAG: carbonic anhydrase [Gammaproteobacteria bacterium]|nr:carbonic anhydrase [Gammaproteobacteria bacterium]